MHNLFKLTQQYIEDLNRFVTKIESVIKKFPTKRNPGADGFTGELRVVKKETRERIGNYFLTHFKKASNTPIPKPDYDITGKGNYSPISDKYRYKILTKILANYLKTFQKDYRPGPSVIFQGTKGS